MDWGSLFWIFLIFSSLQPLLNRRAQEFRRLMAIRELEQKRGSRVILLIHRQESISFWGSRFPATSASRTPSSIAGDSPYPTQYPD